MQTQRGSRAALRFDALRGMLRIIPYREVPARYGKTEYRYTVINDQTVLVEPKTRKIVQIIE